MLELPTGLWHRTRDIFAVLPCSNAIAERINRTIVEEAERFNCSPAFPSHLGLYFRSLIRGLESAYITTITESLLPIQQLFKVRRPCI